MNYVPSLDLIRPAFAEGYAVPSFCVWNSETMQTVLQVASDCRSPVLLMNGPGEFGLLSPARMADTARAMAVYYDVPAALHLDHGDSVGLARECLAAGFTSVMLDLSHGPLNDNIRGVREVVKLAHPRGVTVEGEIGAVGRCDPVTSEGTKASTLTDPGEARRFVTETGMDMVAVSIGNAHGNYPTLPRLDFELLGVLKETTGIPLVLHGGSGTPPDDIRKAISLGIAKINVASELVLAIRERLQHQWDVEKERWLPMNLAEAMQAMAPIVEKWIRRCGSDGKADGGNAG